MTNTTAKPSIKTITIKNASKGCRVELGTNGIYPSAVLIKSDRIKRPQRFQFRSEESRKAYVKNWINEQIKIQQSKTEYRANQKAKQQAVKVGDIFRSSWGYDQTNVDYYQITKLVGKTMVELIEVAQEAYDLTSMSGKCIPKPDEFIGEMMRKKINGDHIKISSSQYAYLETPEVVAGCKIYKGTHFSSYA